MDDRAIDDRESYIYHVWRGHTEIEVPDNLIDLGDDVLIQLTYREGVPVGFIETHAKPDGLGCDGQVIFDVPEAAEITGPKWQLVSLDPLHIEPSVLCGSHAVPDSGCGHHGFVREGRWVSC